MRPTFARINLAALTHNFSIAQKAAPRSKNFAVIKANAYGHGAVQCAQTLNHADAFAVATVEEAVELRQADVDKPILVLSSFSQVDEVDLICHYDLMPVIHSLYQLELIYKHHKQTKPVNCWLKVDTGMNRLGLGEREFVLALEKLNNCKLVIAVGVMSHFASSDEIQNSFTQLQINKFKCLTGELKFELSLANSCAIMACSDSHRDWNRPGIMLYGTSSIDESMQTKYVLKPVMEFCSELIAIKKLKRGESVGYGQRFTADRDMKIGVVACGYADGYPRNMPTGSPIMISGQRTTTLGRVSMDSLSVDLSSALQAKVGDEIILWGESLPVRDVADAVNTIPYELLTQVSKRVPRVYTSLDSHN